MNKKRALFNKMLFFFKYFKFLTIINKKFMCTSFMFKCYKNEK